ncbi:MAG: substrate-binding domain-containing protein [Hyphomicrobiaceae bacterium]
MMCAATIAPVSPGHAIEASIKVQGSTTFNSEILSLHRATIEKAIGRQLSVVANKSSWGLLALIDKRIDLAMISAPLSSEIAAARKLMPEGSFDQLREFRISSTRVAFVVHPQNPLAKLPFETVAQILTGRITNWKAVGGPDLPIVVVAVKEGGGTVVAVRAQMLGDAALATGAIRLENANHVFKAVQQEGGAIGIAQLGLVKGNVARELSMERYVEQPLSFVTLGEPSPEVMAVINSTRAIAGDEDN